MIRSRAVPDFVCVGAARAGTTALYTWLSQHPDIRLSTIKEPNFFSWDQISVNGPGDEASLPIITAPLLPPPVRHAARIATMQAYESLFPNSSGRLTGEISPSYLYYSSICAPRIAAHAPNAKIIAILRNPVDRAVSQYRLFRKVRREINPFAVALELEETRAQSGWEYAWGYHRLGLYNRQLRDYLASFPRSNILVMLYEQIEKSPGASLRRILDFLTLKRHPITTGVPVNTSGRGHGPLVELATKAHVRSAARLLPESFVDVVRHWDRRLANSRSHATGDEFRSVIPALRARYFADVEQLKAQFPELPIARYWSF